MTTKEKETRIELTSPAETSQEEEARLRTLLSLAITIGKREGLMGNHDDEIVKGGLNVADKRNIRNYKATPPGEDKAGDQGGR
jgi:hypothetical protein